MKVLGEHLMVPHDRSKADFVGRVFAASVYQTRIREDDIPRIALDINHSILSYHFGLHKILERVALSQGRARGQCSWLHVAPFANLECAVVAGHIYQWTPRRDCVQSV